MKIKATMVLLAMVCVKSSYAQTPAQEAANGFALFSKNKDFGQLEKAKKAIDRIYKTRKDSSSYRNNLLRTMIYSTLASADVKKSLGYKRDPADEALLSLRQLRNAKQNEEHAQEIEFSKKKLANYFIEKANNDLKAANFAAALQSYQLVDSLNKGDWRVTHNLALLNEQSGNFPKAAVFYKLLTEDNAHSSPEYFLAFAKMYEKTGNPTKMMEVLQSGRERFPDNRDLLFRIINLYADNHQYDAVSSLIDDAIHMDEKNQGLNYLAGYCYQVNGNNALAKKYYKKAIELDANNYDTNYSLGLLCLNLYLRSRKTDEMEEAQHYLDKALDIDRGNTNVLRSLQLLYESSGDVEKLENIKNKLNKDILN